VTTATSTSKFFAVQEPSKVPEPVKAPEPVKPPKALEPVETPKAPEPVQVEAPKQESTAPVIPTVVVEDVSV